jgi:PGF-CTERM protein
LTTASRSLSTGWTFSNLTTTVTSATRCFLGCETVLVGVFHGFGKVVALVALLAAALLATRRNKNN